MDARLLYQLHLTISGTKTLPAERVTWPKVRYRTLLTNLLWRSQRSVILQCRTRMFCSYISSDTGAEGSSQDIGIDTQVDSSHLPTTSLYHYRMYSQWAASNVQLIQSIMSSCAHCTLTCAFRACARLFLIEKVDLYECEWSAWSAECSTRQSMAFSRIVFPYRPPPQTNPAPFWSPPRVQC